MEKPGFRPGEDTLKISELVWLGNMRGAEFQVSQEAMTRLENFRKTVDEKAGGQESCYGINTGFGFLSDVKISQSKLGQLQQNLIRSHACAVGEEAAPEVVRALLILRAHTFLLGHSGIRRESLLTILDFIKHDILPVVPMQGSVGASGDLAPLAHLALGLMGEGEVHCHGERMQAAKALERCGLKPLNPQAKEGLSLINGTHFMTVLAAFAVEQGKNLAKAADIIAALSLDAFKGSLKAFDSRIQKIRPHSGQQLVAQNMISLLCEQNEIMESHKDCGKVQDPYSFRCVPQVHGATRDTLTFVESCVNIELNSITDNPLVFENGDIISGGNFHGQPIAMPMDFLGIAISELGSISERRTEKLTNPSLSSLPPFITKDSGLNSGYMIPHVVAAALASENKSLCHPASVDSIPTSADKEDHVSMGPIAARQALKIIENVSHILAIELLAACQAIDLLKPLKTTPVLMLVYNKVRSLSPYMDQDRSLSRDIKEIAALIKSGYLHQLVTEAGLQLN